MAKQLFLILLLVLSLGLVGCRADIAPGTQVEAGSYSGSQVRYVHDVPHGVGCWFFIDSSGSSLSCLPDSQYKP